MRSSITGYVYDLNGTPGIMYELGRLLWALLSHYAGLMGRNKEYLDTFAVLNARNFNLHY